MTVQPALASAAPWWKDTILQFEGVTLVAALLHQIRRGFAERCNNVATPLVYLGELFIFLLAHNHSNTDC